MLKYSELLEGKPIKDKYHPEWKHRDATHKELDWEYHREYGVHAKHKFPHVFKSREDFQEKHDKAPARYLTPSEHKHLQNSDGDYEHIDHVHADMGHRRDTHRIENDFHKGKTAHPIVLKHDKGTFLLAGNTRRSVASAHGKHLLHKVIDIRSKQD